ncbi:hypothetical protein QTP86_030329, partial [Hemibagrus guttatus]
DIWFMHVQRKLKWMGRQTRQAEQTRPKVCSGDTEGDGPSVSVCPAAEFVPADPPAAKPVAAASSMLDPVMTVSPAVEGIVLGKQPKKKPSTPLRRGLNKYKHKAGDSGELVTDPAEIRKQTVRFYSKLYRSELTAVQEVEEDFVRNLPKITEESARELDRELTLEEVDFALNSMQNGRSPGIDGLPVEFFKAF